MLSSDEQTSHEVQKPFLGVCCGSCHTSQIHLFLLGCSFGQLANSQHHDAEANRRSPVTREIQIVRIMNE
uniref:Phosphomannomutase n=1 Tax=Cyamopsis tetragonoloba TaxID=3832 RepID=A0A678PCT6_CYATE|nr:phosphomannomutase [Cyamopsis tetragonoloba]